jgi:hypothetical protein
MTPLTGISSEPYSLLALAILSLTCAVAFRWDFHHLTKGMHYENISKLIDLIRDDLEELRYVENHVCY